MGITLEQVVPWGRSLDEYIRMFGLTSEDLQANILDCAAGPASFNAEMTRQGYRVISCDPIYQFSASEIEQRIHETSEILKEKIQSCLDAYIWDEFGSPERMKEVRFNAMHQFLQDFPNGLQTKRYCVEELPTLPFSDRHFDLALCSHFLFTYSDHFSEAFHLDAIQELCRVATEVRIFPLLKVSGEPSPFLPRIVAALQQQGYHAQVKTVDYEFQKGGNQLLLCRQTDRPAEE